MKYFMKKHKIGDKRIVKKFLFLPIVIDFELRWFETAYVKQEFAYAEYDSLRTFKWDNLKFVEEQEYNEYVELEEVRNKQC